MKIKPQIIFYENKKWIIIIHCYRIIIIHLINNKQGTKQTLKSLEYVVQNLQHI